MIPVRLKIQGFLSYREAVEIDLRPLRIACITGENGAGKSSLLDAMTWALFGEARKNDASVVNSVTAGSGGAGDKPTAEVAFEFKYEGVLYRVIRRYVIGKSGAAMSVEFHSYNPADASWTILTEKTRRETDKKICGMLHLSYDTFVNASFFLQGKADNFTRANATERKRILSDILNLSIWDVYKKKAQAIESALKTDQRSLVDQAASIDAELSEEDARIARFEEIQAEANRAQERFELAIQRLQNARDAEAMFTGRQSAVEEEERENNRRFRQLESDQRIFDERTGELERTRATLSNADAVRADYQELQAVRARLAGLQASSRRFYELTQAVQTAEHALQLEETRLTNRLDALEERRAQLTELGAAVEAERDRFGEIERDLEAANLRIQTKAAHEKALDELNGRMTGNSVDNKLLRERMKQIEKHLNEVREAAGAACPFCGREMNEDHCKKYEAELSAEGKKLGDAFRANKAENEQLSAEKAALDRELALIRSSEREKIALESERAPLAARREGYAAAKASWDGREAEERDRLAFVLAGKSFGRDEREAIARFQSEIDALGYDRAAHEAASTRGQELAGAEDAYRAVERAAASFAQLVREIGERGDWLETDRADYHRRVEALAGKRAELNEIRKGLPDLQQAQNEYELAHSASAQLQTELGAARQRLEALKELKRQRDSLQSELAGLRKRLGVVEKLNVAFSPKGIPALLIDEALPEIEENANRVLGRLTEERMSIQLTTQGEYKDKSRTDARETLDILIQDETGTRDYELFSGGEAFRVNFAIRLALSAMLTRRAGSRLSLLVIDEGFGSQDADGRQRLIEAIHAIQDDYEKILVITHLEELKDAFQSRIEVVKGENGSSVKVIP